MKKKILRRFFTGFYLDTIYKMSKYRAYKFIINMADEDGLNLIYNNEHYNYLLVCKKPDNTLQGLIRFPMQKPIKTVIGYFYKNTTIEPSIKADKAYKNEFMQDSTIIFEATNNKNKNKDAKNVIQLLNKQEKLIIDLVNEKTSLTNLVSEKTNLVNENEKLTNQFVEHQSNIISQLLKLKEDEHAQIKQLVSLCLEHAKNNPTIINSTTNNTINNKFNLKIFLNEQCKDAVNLIDFAKGIHIKLQDLSLYNNLGHADAVTRIFDNAYKKLDLKMRPIHCTDLKRETLYVRNENEWLNDETKEISEKAMEIVSNNSFTQIKQWKDANPDYEINDRKKNEYVLFLQHFAPLLSWIH
ncbi:hypothetical protein EBU24_01555 [bacterium]|nr:hypothetical protein [bacterium]